MVATAVCILNAEETQLVAVIDGRDCGPVYCHRAGSMLVIDGDGEIVRAVQDYIAQGGSVAPYSAPAVTDAQVVAERERRLALGFDYRFGDGRGLHRIGTTPADMLGWADVTQATQAMIALGGGASMLAVVTDTGPVMISALEWQQILLAAAANRQPIWTASFRLQNTNPIPIDYTSDKYWV